MRGADCLPDPVEIRVSVRCALCGGLCRCWMPRGAGGEQRGQGHCDSVLGHLSFRSTGPGVRFPKSIYRAGRPECRKGIGVRAVGGGLRFRTKGAS